MESTDISCAWIPTIELVETISLLKHFRRKYYRDNDAVSQANEIINKLERCVPKSARQSCDHDVADES